jgi:hypothetical protein
LACERERESETEREREKEREGGERESVCVCGKERKKECYVCHEHVGRQISVCTVEDFSMSTGESLVFGIREKVKMR